MNVEIRAEAALFPEKEYINGNAVAVWRHKTNLVCSPNHRPMPLARLHSIKRFLG
jgi:hypothetical protein